MLVASAPILVLSVLTVLIVLFVPPSNSLIVSGFILLVGALVYRLARWKLAKRYASLATFTTIGLLGLLAIGLFDIINASLFAGLLIGIAILLK